MGISDRLRTNDQSPCPADEIIPVIYHPCDGKQSICKRILKVNLVDLTTSYPAIGKMTLGIQSNHFLLEL